MKRRRGQTDLPTTLSHPTFSSSSLLGNLRPQKLPLPVLVDVKFATAEAETMFSIRTRRLAKIYLLSVYDNWNEESIQRIEINQWERVMLIV